MDYTEGALPDLFFTHRDIMLVTIIMATNTLGDHYQVGSQTRSIARTGTSQVDNCLNRHAVSMVPTGMQYRDYHKIIRTIENCSLRATFGPEITSTGKLLPKESSASPVVAHKASHEIDTDLIEKRARLTKIPPFSAKAHINASLLPIESANQDGNSPSDLTRNGDGVVLANQDDKIISMKPTNRASTPVIFTCEDSIKFFQHGHFVGQEPLDVWGQQVTYQKCNSLSVSFANIVAGVIRLINFACAPTRRESIATFATYLTQITSIQITTVSGTQRTFSASAVPKILWRNA